MKIRSQASQQRDDLDPMVRDMVAVAIRPKHREEAEAMVDAIADERSGVTSTWVMAAAAARPKKPD
jgi:hypothetical protein